MVDSGQNIRSATLSAAQRFASFVEFAIGAAIVVGHNVFHLVPNEVPILFVLCIASVRLREGSFAAIGLNRPRSWWTTVGIAVATAALVLAVGQFVTDPLAQYLGLHATGAGAKALGTVRGDVGSALRGLALIWTFAAFGEELGYRRYLLGRAADALGGSQTAYWAALVAASILFGIGHFYQGPAGMFTTAIDGFIIGAAYLLSRRNLWVAVLAHGLIDTAGIVLLFFGLAD
jgi:membrane protease YdiL (CAAX protease family)